MIEFFHLDALEGPDAAEADLLRLMRWEARGKPGTNFIICTSITFLYRFTRNHT